MTQQHRFELIGVGSPIVDSLARVDESFIQTVGGSKGGMELVTSAELAALMAKLDQFAEAPGGSAGNTAVAVARLGLPTTFLGKIGNDVGGEFYKDRFQALGGDISRFKVGSIPNGRCLSLITPDSERTMRTDLGAAMTLSADEITVSDFEGCRHAHIEGYVIFNRDLMLKVLQSAKAAGCTTSIDLASFEVVHASRDILEDILRDYVDVVFANEEEAGAFTGLNGDYEGSARALAKLCPISAVKLGARGSLIFQGDQLTLVPPVPAPGAVDTTGAGDLWAGGFLYGWLRGQPMEVCGHYGSILGAEVVQVIGAAIPDKRWRSIVKQFQ